MPQTGFKIKNPSAHRDLVGGPQDHRSLAARSTVAATLHEVCSCARRSPRGQGTGRSPPRAKWLRMAQAPQDLSQNGYGYAIVPPGHKSAFRAGFWQDCYRESTEIDPPAGRRLAGRPISMLSGNSPAKIQPGRRIYGPEALPRNIENG